MYNVIVTSRLNMIQPNKNKGELVVGWEGFLRTT